MLATIEVNFRFAGLGFDEKTEHQRTNFNLALAGFKSQDPKRQERAVATFEELAGQKFPPAMYAYGTLLRAGQFVNKDAEKGRALIAKAADKNFGPAIHELGAMYLEAKQSPADIEKGIQLFRDAAMLGSKQAQYALAARYKAGDGLPRDQERARYFFRLCAAGGDVNCQFRLGKLLFELPARRERDYLQAIAFLQLAADQGVAQAKSLADAETARLNPEQVRWVNKLKVQLVRPQ